MVRSSSVGVGVGDNSGVSFFPELKSSFSPSLNPFAEGSEYTGISLSADVPPDGDEPFYQKLDADSVPFTGSGTEDDPYVYLCSSAKEKEQ